ncbi:hypothetical protein NMY22_g18870 [Coprinellus aureogranulatus]|nr:hypothetical protein NMY22_g18870 [Coprinellus aureogranulatus]
MAYRSSYLPTTAIDLQSLQRNLSSASYLVRRDWSVSFNCSEIHGFQGVRRLKIDGTEGDAHGEWHRTGAPGKHVIGGRAKYRLIDEKVRVFVAPPVEEIATSPLKPYVSVKCNLTPEEERIPFGRFRGAGGLTPEHFLRVAREHDRLARMGLSAFRALPGWYNAEKTVKGESPMQSKIVDLPADRGFSFTESHKLVIAVEFVFRYLDFEKLFAILGRIALVIEATCINIACTTTAESALETGVRLAPDFGPNHPFVFRTSPMPYDTRAPSTGVHCGTMSPSRPQAFQAILFAVPSFLNERSAAAPNQSRTQPLAVNSIGRLMVGCTNYAAYDDGVKVWAPPLDRPFCNHFCSSVSYKERHVLYSQSKSMDAPQPAVTSQRDGDERSLVLTSITFDLSDSSNGQLLPSNLTELWIFVEGGPEEGTCCPLDSDSPQRWTMNGSIGFSPGVTEMQCVVKDQEEQDVGFVHLQGDELQMTGEHVHNMIPADSPLALTMWWQVIEMPSEARVRIRVVQMPLEVRTAVPKDRAALEQAGIESMLCFEHSRDINDVNNAISLFERVVRGAPPRAVELPPSLHNLTIALSNRFGLTGDLSDLTEAITMTRRIIGLTPNGHPIPSLQLHSRRNLGELLVLIALAISPISDVVALLSLLKGLGNSLKSRFKHTENLADLDEAISVQRRGINIALELHVNPTALPAQQMSVQLTPDDLPTRMERLGELFGLRFEHSRDPGDLSEAISLLQRGVDLTAQDHAELPNRISKLGAVLLFRSERTVDLSEMSRAILAQQKAVVLTPEGHPDLPKFLDRLGSSFAVRSQHAGDLSDVANAVLSHQRAVQLTPDDDPDLPAWLHNLGDTYLLRSRRDGNLSNVDKAISTLERAIHLTPCGHADLPRRLDSLGECFWSRSNFTGDVSDISEAISADQRAVQLTAVGDRCAPDYLANLALSFSARFKCTGHLPDLEEALSARERQEPPTSPTDASLSRQARDLARSFLKDIDGQTVDLASTIAAHRRIIRLIPQGHSSVPLALSVSRTSGCVTGGCP